MQKTRKKVSKKDKGSDFENQLAKRVSEAMIIDTLHDEIISKHTDEGEKIENKSSSNLHKMLHLQDLLD